jgi:hypothetical protein
MSLFPKAMNKNKRPLGLLGRNINRRKPHQRSSPVDQRIGRNAHFMTIQVKVNIHAGSVHEAGRDVNLRIKELRQKIWRSKLTCACWRGSVAGITRTLSNIRLEVAHTRVSGVNEGSPAFRQHERGIDYHIYVALIPGIVGVTSGLHECASRPIRCPLA